MCAVFSLTVVLATRLNSQSEAGLKLALDFLTAAGLLRLSGLPSWTSVATVVGLTSVRRSLTPTLIGRTRETSGRLRPEATRI